MSRPVKVILTIVVLAALAAAVTGVAYWSMGHDPDRIEPGLYVKERRISDPGIMLTIGDNEVPFEVYRHYFLVSRNMFTTYYGETIWEDDLDGDRALVLRDAVESELVNLYAWLQIAEETSVTLTEDDYAELEATLAEQKEQLGDDFEARLEEMGFSSEESYLEISAMQQLSSKVQTEYNEAIRKEVEKSAGDKAEQEYLDDYITAKHILVAFDTEEEDTEKAEADALAKAEDLMDQLLAAKAEAEANAEPPAESEDGEEAEPTVNEDFEKAFDELMFANTDDLDGTEANPDGYTFKEGDMVEEFYEGALALGIGELSEPIKTTYGYHIILRLPLDTTGLEEYKESAISTEVSNKVAEKTAAVKEGLPVVGGPYYDGLTPYSIY